MIDAALDLTDAQLTAVMSGDKDTMVVAGPGSGKTTVVVERVRFLVRSGVDPQEIVVLAYTVAAAGEIAARLGDLEVGFVGTMHGFCLRFLRDYVPGMDSLSVVGEEESDAELRRIADSLGVKCSTEKLRRGRRGDFVGFSSAERLAVASYRRAMAGYGMTDFDSLVLTALAWLTKPGAARWRVAHLVVDEIQDATLQDFEVYRDIGADCRFFVGDTDQSIFAFRGGRPDIVRRMSESGEWRVVKLEGNFRCGPEICAAAQKLIEHAPGRVQKATTSFVNAGARVDAKEWEDDVAEAMGICGAIQTAVAAVCPEDPRGYADFAVLARTNSIADHVAWYLEAGGIPVRRRRRPEMTKERRLAVAALSALASRSEFAVSRYWRALHGDAEADAKISLEYRRGNFLTLAQEPELRRTPEALAGDLAALLVDPDEAAAICAVRDAAEQPATLADVQLAAEDLEEVDQGAGVTVTTVHGAKGREWHTVVLAGFEDEVVPAQRDEAEERRVAYVGITRAKRNLFVSHARMRQRGWGGRELAPHAPSRFITEAGL